MNILFSKPTRRAILGSCLTALLLAAALPAKADNPPKFKDPELNAFVQKYSDLFDSLGAAIKAEDEAVVEDSFAKMDALANGNSGVVTKDGMPQPGKASPEETAAYRKWLGAEADKTGVTQLVRKGNATKSLAYARQIGLALKLYAVDHDGEYPKTLDALFPDYLQQKKLLVSPFAPNEPLGYTYHTGLTDASDPKSTLLEDKFAPKVFGQKIVVYLDGSGEVTK